MEAGPGSEPIEDDEILYRRVPANPKVNWYNPETKKLSSNAFNPREDDAHGISLSRAKYTKIEHAARGQPGKSYYVTKFRAGDLRKNGMVLDPDPLPDEWGHAKISNLNYENRKSDAATAFKVNLATRLCVGVGGPFDPAPE